MSIIGVLLLVTFVIVCFLIIALVLLQSDEGSGLGGLFAGGSNSAFGSRSANVVTKATYVVVALFFITAFFMAFINKTPDDMGVEAAARLEQGNATTEWWKANDQTPAADTSAVESPVPNTPVAP